MPPQAKFTKEEIVDSALMIVERSGLEFLTARSLGVELGSSSRPIFTVFTGMEQVIEAVKVKVKEIYGDYVEQGLKEDLQFKGVGKAYIRFAFERPKLFQMLFMSERDERPDSKNVLIGIEDHYEAIIGSIVKGYGLSMENAKELYFHLWVYSHGIAVLIATKVCSFTADETDKLLTQVFISLTKKLKQDGKL